jgi:aspartate-semialdehyde dehydrogenase
MLSEMMVSPLEANLPAEIEPEFARAGYLVCSNASAFRYDADIPLLIPEVNASHLSLVERQRGERGWSGLIVTSPNCTTSGMVIPLKPLDDTYGLQKVFATSMQAISGAGYPGIPSLDVLNNVVPFIKGEEWKVELETRIMLGNLTNGVRDEADVVVSAHANRVPVLDGHTICLSLGFENPPSHIGRLPRSGKCAEITFSTIPPHPGAHRT